MQHGMPGVGVAHNYDRCLILTSHHHGGIWYIMCYITSKLAKCNYKRVAEMVFLTVTTLFNFICCRSAGGGCGVDGVAG